MSAEGGRVLTLWEGSVDLSLASPRVDLFSALGMEMVGD